MTPHSPEDQFFIVAVHYVKTINNGAKHPVFALRDAAVALGISTSRANTLRQKAVEYVAMGCRFTETRGKVTAFRGAA